MIFKRFFCGIVFFTGLLVCIYEVHAVLPASQESMDKKLALLPPPSSWGKNIAGSSGELSYKDKSKGNLIGKIEIRGLSPDHEYMLTINGILGKSGNDHLPEIYGTERYHDFMKVKTDNKGDISADISLPLAPDKYEVKFFVKDITDWKIVLYNNLLSFIVK